MKLNKPYLEDYPCRMVYTELDLGLNYFGIDYEGIRYVIQNRVAHYFLTNPNKWNLDPKIRMKSGKGDTKCFKVSVTKHSFYFIITSGGSTLW